MKNFTALEEEFELVQEDKNGEEIEPSDSKLVHMSRKDKFLSSIEDKVDNENSVQSEHLTHIKTQVVDKIRSTKIRRVMARTDSASSSVVKRRLSFHEDEGRASSRHRTEPLLLPRHDGEQ